MQTISLGSIPLRSKATRITFDTLYRFLRRVEKVCGEPPLTACLRLQGNELVCSYCEHDSQGMNYAFWCKAHVPDHWTGEEPEKKWRGS